LPLEVQQSIKAEYQQFRKTNNQMPFAFGSKYNFREDAATEATQEELRTEYEQRWRTGGLPFLGAFGDLLFDMGANDTAGDFIRNKIHETVQDTAVAETLSPRQVVGCKRLCADTNYYETYNRPNVTLVDISGDPIECITPDGVRAKGENFEFDCIVFATGFDAMTGALFNMDIRGRDGLELREKWSAGPRTYLGLTTAGFPNFFTISGPGSPSVLTNMLPSIEQHVEWIADCVAYLQSNDYASIEPSSEAEDAWVDHVNAVADTTLYPTCNSWYLGANVPGKPRVFMPYVGFPPYVEKCNEVVAKGYDGFKLSAVSQA